MKKRNDWYKYYKNVRKLFPIHSKQEKDFFIKFKQGIEEYCSENDEVKYDNLVQEFGTPIDVVVSYYQTIESTYILKKINTRNTIKIFITVILILCFITVGWRWYYYYQSYLDYQESIPAYGEIFIEEVN